jgi:hypothetical protein
MRKLKENFNFMTRSSQQKTLHVRHDFISDENECSRSSWISSIFTPNQSLRFFLHIQNYCPSVSVTREMDQHKVFCNYNNDSNAIK